MNVREPWQREGARNAPSEAFLGQLPESPAPAPPPRTVWVVIGRKTGETALSAFSVHPSFQAALAEADRQDALWVEAAPLYEEDNP